MDADEVDAVEKVFAEGVFLHHGGEVRIGGADDTDIGAACVAVAQYLVGLILKHSEQLHLAGEVEFSDFVEEDGASLGEFESPYPILFRIGEGTFLVIRRRGREGRPLSPLHPGGKEPTFCFGAFERK